jgi:radical SAM superfamily enzyme YgiQ (UPF0313 family)
MKIAFVAMSGVRVRSRELQALGVTLPGFVERGRVIASLPSLGLLTLAALTPPDVHVRYHESEDVTPERLADEGSDVVAISTFTAQAPEAYALADECRVRGMRVAIGGLHATVCPDEAALHADHVFVGEAEETWPEFVEDLRRRRPRPRYDARGRTYSLDRAPLPRYDLLDVERYNRITVQTTRSCPHRCSFCASGVLLRGPYRKKPTELVQRDLEAIRARWPRPFIELADDNTFVDKRWGRELVSAIASQRVRWFTETDVTVADDPALLEALGDSGCRQLLIGLEALDVRTVAGLEERPFKARRVADYARAVRAIQSHGVSVNGTFVVGADDQGREAFAAVVAFAERVGLAEVQVTVLTPFPGTPLHDRMAREGRLLRTADWASMTLFDVTYRPARMTVRELEEGLRDLFPLLYASERVRARRRSFRAQVRAGRRERAAHSIGQTMRVRSFSTGTL